MAAGDVYTAADGSDWIEGENGRLHRPGRSMSFIRISVERMYGKLTKTSPEATQENEADETLEDVLNHLPEDDREVAKLAFPKEEPPPAMPTTEPYYWDNLGRGWERTTLGHYRHIESGTDEEGQPEVDVTVLTYEKLVEKFGPLRTRGVQLSEQATAEPKDEWGEDADDPIEFVPVTPEEPDQWYDRTGVQWTRFTPAGVEPIMLRSRTGREHDFDYLNSALGPLRTLREVMELHAQTAVVTADVLDKVSGPIRKTKTLRRDTPELRIEAMNLASREAVMRSFDDKYDAVAVAQMVLDFLLGSSE